MSNPTVAVIIPCYNGEAVLTETIDALLNQSYPPDEIIVVDDGSSDRSVAVAESFGPPVHVVKQSNAGAAAARYTGVMHAGADIVVFNDAGDISLPNRVNELRQALIDHSECVAAFGVTWTKPRPRPSVSAITGGPLDGTTSVLRDPLSHLLKQSSPLAIGMNLAVRRDVATESVRISPFYRAGNDYALQVSTARHGPFAHVASLSMEYEMSVAGLSDRYGWTQQTGYALCAATEAFEREKDRRDLDRKAFRRRVEEDWTGIALFVYLKRNRSLLKRVISIGLRYGCTSRTPTRFWWALDSAHEKRLLTSERFLRWLAQIGRALRWRG